MPVRPWRGEPLKPDVERAERSHEAVLIRGKAVGKRRAGTDATSERLQSVKLDCCSRRSDLLSAVIICCQGRSSMKRLASLLGLVAMLLPMTVPHAFGYSGG